MQKSGIFSMFLALYSFCISFSYTHFSVMKTSKITTVKCTWLKIVVNSYFTTCCLFVLFCGSPAKSFPELTQVNLFAGYRNLLVENSTRRMIIINNDNNSVIYPRQCLYIFFTGLRIPTDRTQTSFLFTRVVEDLFSGLPWTNPVSGQGGTVSKAASR